jgi:hypothetical protein
MVAGGYGESVTARASAAERRKGLLLAWASLATALIGLGAVLYTGRFGDTRAGVAFAYASGPLAVAFGAAAWWRTRNLGPRVLAVLAIAVAILVMSLIAYVVWWAITQSR